MAGDDDLRLSDRLATTIGWIAIESAELEYATARLAVALLNADAAWPMLGGQGWAHTQQSVLVLVGLRAESDAGEVEFADQVKETMREARALMERRNNLVHATWLGLDNDNPRDPVIPKRWGKNRRPDDWDHRDAEALRGHLRRVRDDIVEHTQRVEGTLP